MELTKKIDSFDIALADAQGQRSDAWHSVRLGRFTSSEIHKLIGEPKTKNQWGLTDTASTYIKEKAAEILTGRPQLSPDTIATQWGVEQEVVCKSLMQDRGYVIEETGFHPYEDHAGGSPDGFIIAKETSVLEIKSPFHSVNHIKHLIIQDQDELKKVCKEYYWQVQANMLFTGKQSALFVSFDPRMSGKELHLLPVEVNTTDIVLLNEAIGKASKYLKHILELLK